MDNLFYKEVSIPAGNVIIKGNLFIPAHPNAIIIFSHGSGSSRFSKRNQQVAAYLQNQHFGTLLLDLLTFEEDAIYGNRFDINLLSERLMSVTKWLKAFPAAAGCHIGYFGASTGAASALHAASKDHDIAAVVSRGGRPDLAISHLHDVKAPTLLIVGSLDKSVIELNEMAYKKLECTKKMVIVEGASHLFEEPGKMDSVSKLAGDWFEKYMQTVNA